jgi:hypothetical protein
VDEARIALDGELDVRVVQVHPWGADIITDGGELGLVDSAKLRSVREFGTFPEIGDVLHVVVLDDMRSPFRASTLAIDISIARGSREE